MARAALSSLAPSAPRVIEGADVETAGPALRTEGLMGFSNVAGVLLAGDQEKFARTIFRATRGNAFTHFESISGEIFDTKTAKPVQKSVFVTYFQAAEAASALKDKIVRICQAYNVNFYDWPKSSAEAAAQMASLDEVIQDKAKALEAYESFFVSESAALLEVHRVRRCLFSVLLLSSVSAGRWIFDWWLPSFLFERKSDLRNS